MLLREEREAIAMAKLLILDKDGTLVKPKSGKTFVQHPEDQELLHGVKEAIARYAADGWTMAIASNQGGCMWTKTSAMSCPTPGYIRYDGKIIKVESKYSSDYKTYFFQEGQTESVFSVAKTELLEFCYKTVEDAIAEMQYCLNLLSQISFALFCPDIYGKECWWVGREMVQPSEYFSFSFFNYRKPNPGMLVHIMGQYPGASQQFDSKNCLMVGDRPEDELAAKAAGVTFMAADEWRGDRVQ